MACSTWNIPSIDLTLTPSARSPRHVLFHVERAATVNSKPYQRRRRCPIRGTGHPPHTSDGRKMDRPRARRNDAETARSLQETASPPSNAPHARSPPRQARTTDRRVQSMYRGPPIVAAPGSRRSEAELPPTFFSAPCWNPPTSGMVATAATTRRNPARTRPLVAVDAERRPGTALHTG